MSALSLLPTGLCVLRALRSGIEALHLGVIFLVTLEPRFLHSAVGINLFLASYRCNRPLGERYGALRRRIGVVGR
jgi:TRAP-type C4-dicarboxylate transport system permease large subunit